MGDVVSEEALRVEVDSKCTIYRVMDVSSEKVYPLLSIQILFSYSKLLELPLDSSRRFGSICLEIVQWWHFSYFTDISAEPDDPFLNVFTRIFHLIEHLIVEASARSYCQWPFTVIL